MHSMRTTVNPFVFWVSFVCAFLPLSCQSRFRPTYPVRGKVSFEGKPTPGARVFFTYLDAPEDPIVKPMATVDDDGNFILSTYRKEDGAPAGSYSVTIIWLPKGYQGPLEKANKLPAHYASDDTSGLKATVDPKENELPPFALTK